MLHELRIKNFAVIDELTLELGPGLNVLTGETGAGKTIILNALGLILGARGASDLIRHGEDEATVEALFGQLPPVVRDKLAHAGHGAEDELVLKRVVSRPGKNRIYLNGGMAPLGLLGELGSELVHIYGQHQHQSLLRIENHGSLLDAYAGLEAKVAMMQDHYEAFAGAWRALQEQKETLEDKRRGEEALRAQVDEILGASLRADEEQELQDRRQILLHAEKLFQGCREGETVLYEGDHAVMSELGRYTPRLRELAKIDAALDEAVRLMESAEANLEEATAVLRRYTDRMNFDSRELEHIDDRLAEINRLKRKYRGSVEEILGILEQSERELEALETGDEELLALSAAFETARDRAWKLAEELSRSRKRAAKKLAKQMEAEAAGLGMSNAVFEVVFKEGEDNQDEPPFLLGGRKMTASGIDEVEFFFSPNPGEPPKPLARIASGGELSRMMLALKSLVLQQREVPTLLFDEVDAGIGGRVAELVGQKLAKVGETRQVLCVTHLPQIAALAEAHYIVEKKLVRGRTFTSVKKLSDKERVRELARMLGGSEITEQAERHAESLLKPS